MNGLFTQSDLDTDDGFAPLLARRAAAEPDRLFARFAGEPLSFAALERMAAALALWLRRSGIAPGDVVALMLRNSKVALALLFALAKARAIWVPLNVQGRGDNLRFLLDHAAPRLIVAEADLIEIIRSSGAGLAGARLATATEAEAAALQPATAWSEPPTGAEETFAVMYTSGTTGRPKGVLVSHRMLRLSGEAVALVSAARAGDVMMMWEPLFHIGGAQMIVLPLIRDVTLALVAGFSAGRFWAEVKRFGATHIHFLGGILQILLKQPPSDLDRAHGARIAWGGGCPADIWLRFEQRFGVEIRECYGMTECSSVTTGNLVRAVGSVGTPLPWFKVAILRPDGTPAAPGERGEIVVRTSLPGALTRGYLKDPEATAQALRDGAFFTGDRGSFDADGRMYFHGRITDSVRVKGENVSAFEVEHVAARHPAVEDCAMIGVAAEVGEQDIKLFVKARPGVALTARELSAWLGERLARYQNPRYIVLVDDFERTASQRIMKHKLSRRTDEGWDRLA